MKTEEEVYKIFLYYPKGCCDRDKNGTFQLDCHDCYFRNRTKDKESLCGLAERAVGSGDAHIPTNMKQIKKYCNKMLVLQELYKND